jgi:hypothetical protein
MRTNCKEVCVAPRFCQQKGVHGTDLEKRSLHKMVARTIRACKDSGDASEKAFYVAYKGGTTSGARYLKRDKAVKSLLTAYDKDRNGALSFSEFLVAIQNKPWVALLRSAALQSSSTSVSVAQVKAVANGNGRPSSFGTLRELFDDLDIDGALQQRDGYPGRKACCFRDCHTPKSWRVAKESWCWEAALRAAAGT